MVSLGIRAEGSRAVETDSQNRFRDPAGDAAEIEIEETAELGATGQTAGDVVADRGAGASGAKDSAVAVGAAFGRIQHRCAGSCRNRE